ncbi:MAG TPA: hypothetical protein VF791_22755 [Pyrinomonadaceae bacterium]
MDCCAGKPPHEAGSCSVAFAGKAKTKAHDRHGEHAAHDSTQHQAHPISSVEESKPAATVTSQAMTTPCSPACAAAALSSAQLRRPRETAATAVAHKTQPLTVKTLKRNFCKPPSTDEERRRQTRPRAPPFSL